ncbi:Hypothetical predicted protein, partial [Paramuricea clavata]
GNNSTITAKTIDATNIDNSGTINGDSSAASTITATNIKNSKNITKGGGKLTIVATELTNTAGGTIGTSGVALTEISVTTSIDNSHLIYAGTIKATAINNKNGTITADFALPATTNKTSKITNFAKANIVSSSMVVTEVSNSGAIRGTNLTIVATELTNSVGGTIGALNAALTEISVTTSIDNSHLIYAGTITGAGLTINNKALGIIYATTITTANITNLGEIGTVTSGKAFKTKTITANTSIDNSHLIYAGKIHGTDLTINNKLAASKIIATEITAKDITNLGEIGTVTSGKAVTTITATGKIDNSLNIFADTIEANQIDNDGAINLTGGNKTITAPTINNTANGTINAKFANASGGTTITNSGGTIESAEIKVKIINNTKGTIKAKFTNASGNTKLTNASGANIESTDITVNEIDNSGEIGKTTPVAKIEAKTINNKAGTIKAKFTDASTKLTNAQNAKIESTDITVDTIDNSGDIGAAGTPVTSITATTKIDNSNKIYAKKITGTSLAINNLVTASKIVADEIEATTINNNAGTIKAKFTNSNTTITNGAATGKKAIIEITADNSTAAMHVDNYTGQDGNDELHINFSGALSGLNGLTDGIIHIATKATFASTSKIILCSDAANKATSATNTAINLIKLDTTNQQLTVNGHSTVNNTILDSILYTKVFSGSNNSKKYAIIAKNIKYNNSILSATLKAEETKTGTVGDETLVTTFIAAQKALAGQTKNAKATTNLNASYVANVLTLKPGSRNKCYFDLNSIPTGSNGGIYSKISDIKKLEIESNTTGATSFEFKFKQQDSSKVLNLTDGLVIDDNVTITNDFTINDVNIIINADIVNNGTITKGVVIGESSKTAFPLRPGTTTNANTTAKFTNLGTVNGGFDIKGQEATGASGNNVDTFELVNGNGTTAGNITGNITLDSNDSSLKFKLTNTQGTISSNEISVTYIDNKETIKNNGSSLTITATEITNTTSSGAITATEITTTDYTKSKIINQTGAKIEADSITINKIENSGTIGKSDGSNALIITASKTYNSGTIKAKFVYSGGDTSIINSGGTITSKEIKVKTINNNKGTIKAKFAIPTSGTTKTASIINKAIIEITAAAQTAMKVDNYTGEDKSELCILFSQLSKITGPIINITKAATFTSTSKIVLCGDASTASTAKAKAKVNVTLITAATIKVATGTDANASWLTTGGTILDGILYSRVFDKNKIIKASSIIFDAGSITVDLKVVKATTGATDTLSKDVVADTSSTSQSSNASPGTTTTKTKHLEKTIKHEVAHQAVASMPKQVANIDLGELVAEIQHEEYYQQAASKYSDPEAFADAILPDTSNAQVTASSNIANKLADNISSHAISKVGSSSRPAKNLGISSGDLTDEITVWAGFSYILSLENPNAEKHDYSHTNAMVFNLGADGKLENDINIGLSYGYSRANAKVKGGSASKDKAEHTINYHSLAAYASTGFKDIDTSLSVNYSYVSSSGKDLDKKIDPYGTNIVGFNSAAIYSLLSHANTSIDIIANIGANIIMVGKHKNKSGKDTQESTNKLFNTGIGCAINKTVALSEKNQFSYNLASVYKFTKTAENKTKVEVTSGHTVEIMPRAPGAHKLNIDALLNLELNKKLSFDLDLNLTLGLGQSLLEFGGSFVTRYAF